MTRRFPVMLLVLLCACAIVVSEPTPSLDPLAGLEPEIREAILTRQHFGLRADEAWVRQVAAIPNADHSTLDIPLTPAEAREIQERFTLSEDASTIAAAYGAQHPDTFAGIRIDQAHGSRVIIRFTAEMAMHQAALDALWGEPGFILVEAATFTQAALEEIQTRIVDAADELEAQGIQLLEAGSGGAENSVHVVAKSDNPRAEAILAALGPRGSIEVELYPADKPWSNPAGGPGWRFLGSFPTERPYEVALALTPDEFTRQLRRFGIDVQPMAWRPESEIIAFFSEGIGSTCTEVRIDAVTFDLRTGLVYPTLSDPLAPRACTADLGGGQTFIVALVRDALPDRFTLILKPDLPHLGEVEGTLE